MYYNMTIIEIEEIQNDTIYDLKPIKEVMDIYVPDIIDNVSRRNGMIYILTGSGGSGKSSLLVFFCPKTRNFKNVTRGKKQHFNA